MTKIPYIESLSPLRGVAALWVVLFHIDVCLFYRNMGGLLPRDLTGIFSKAYLWVDFFFLLSGFIMAHVYGASLAGPNKLATIRAYLWARFSRLYPLHLFTLALLVVFSLVVPQFLPSVIDGSWSTFFAWSAIPSNLLFTNAMNQHVYLSWNLVSWSIGAEWWTYVLAIVFLIALHRHRLVMVALVIGLAFACLLFLLMQLPDHNLDITFNYGFFRCLFEFVIGVGLYELYRHGIAKNWLQRDRIFLLLLLLITAIFHWRIADLCIIPVFSCLILAAAYNRSRAYQTLTHSYFRTIGDISYSLYLMHGVWFMFLWYSLPLLKSATGMLVMPLALKLCCTALFLTVTIASAHWTHRTIEVGARQCLRRWFFNAHS